MEAAARGARDAVYTVETRIARTPLTAVLIALPPPGWVPLLAVGVVIAAVAATSRPLRAVDTPR